MHCLKVGVWSMVVAKCPVRALLGVAVPPVGLTLSLCDGCHIYP